MLAPEQTPRVRPEELTLKIANRLVSIAASFCTGVTLDWTGETLDLTEGDVVTLGGHNLNTSRPELEKIPDLLHRVAWVLASSHARTCLGLFQVAPSTVSLDFNVVVPRAHREASLAFARFNNQQSIWDAEKSEVVPAGGDGSKSTLDPWTSAIRMKWTAEDLTEGKYFYLPNQNQNQNQNQK